MRISDWSSDVCSSDLLQFDKGAAKVWQFTERCTRALVSVDTTCCAAASAAICSAELRSIFCGDLIAVMYQRVRPDEGVPSSQDRSEEHTSELQSLMRNSYAVVCLKTQSHKVTDVTVERVQN